MRITARTVEIFYRGRRVGAHQRRTMGRKHGTDPDHMPSSHRRYADWTPDRFRRWAGKIWPNTEGLIAPFKLMALRKSETVRKSGGSSPPMLMKSTRSRGAFAIRRDE